MVDPINNKKNSVYENTNCTTLRNKRPKPSQNHPKLHVQDKDEEVS